MRTTQSVVMGWIHDAVAPAGWLITDMEDDCRGYLRIVQAPQIGSPRSVYDPARSEPSSRTPARSVKFCFGTHDFRFDIWAGKEWTLLTKFKYDGSPYTYSWDHLNVDTIDEAVKRVVEYLVEGKG